MKRKVYDGEKFAVEQIANRLESEHGVTVQLDFTDLSIWFPGPWNDGTGAWFMCGNASGMYNTIRNFIDAIDCYKFVKDQKK